MPLTEYTFNVENPVDRIFYGRINIKKANSFLFFTENGVVRRLLHNLKYRNQEKIGAFLGDWFGQNIKENGFLDEIDFVIPVPLHAKRQRKRGYNQVALFGQRMAFHLGAEYVENLLVKTYNSKTQTQRGRWGRWFENKSLYKVTDTEAIEGKTLLLIDDVITTGSTIELCAKALKSSKNVTLYVASMAVVPLVYK